MTIKVGDVVRCERTQGQDMTVDSLGEWCGKPACVCKWFTHGGKLHEAGFNLDELQVVEPEKAIVGG